MPKKRILSPQSVWEVDAVAKAFECAGVKPFHLNKLYYHLLKNPTSSWEDVFELPKAAISILNEQFTLMSSKLIHYQQSSDNETIKLLIELQDGLQIESVIMKYDTTGCDPNNEQYGNERATLCVSSEVGCVMGCTFCATGTMGLTADLTTAEIIEQLVHARRIEPIKNIVFMGMGEPLNNYNAVKSALTLITHPQVFALRQRGVTVSTVGVIPRILQLAEDFPKVSLALSLHAPNQELRQRIVPSARAYKLDKLMAAVDAYIEKAQHRVFVEYVMLGPDINCLPEHAHELGRLLQDKDVVINLIPWNPILSPAIDFAAPIPGSTEKFQDILKKEYGLPSTIRKEKGQDVSAACGQLVLDHGGRSCGSTKSHIEGKEMSGDGEIKSRGHVLKDVEDLLGAHSRKIVV